MDLPFIARSASPARTSAIGPHLNTCSSRVCSSVEAETAGLLEVRSSRLLSPVCGFRVPMNGFFLLQLGRRCSLGTRGPAVCGGMKSFQLPRTFPIHLLPRSVSPSPVMTHKGKPCTPMRYLHLRSAKNRYQLLGVGTQLCRDRDQLGSCSWVDPQFFKSSLTHQRRTRSSVHFHTHWDSANLDFHNHWGQIVGTRIQSKQRLIFFCLLLAEKWSLYHLLSHMVKLVHNRREQMQTGGEEPELHVLTEVEERVSDLMGTQVGAVAVGEAEPPGDSDDNEPEVQQPVCEASTSNDGRHEEEGEDSSAPVWQNPPAADGGDTTLVDELIFLVFDEPQVPGHRGLQQCSARREAREPAHWRCSCKVLSQWVQNGWRKAAHFQWRRLQMALEDDINQLAAMEAEISAIKTLYHGWLHKCVDGAGHQLKWICSKLCAKPRAK
uniref:uncharacterized protein n=1 Tax=Pristiophorus japonicus TaxID=55135 RepID=UPI00398F86C4